MKQTITVCAFQDGRPNSVAYRKFEYIDAAVKFYKQQLEKPNVNVISTRKVCV